MVRREPPKFLFNYIPTSRPKIISTRGGTSFWVTAGDAGVRSSILTVPVTFPPEDVHNGELKASPATEALSLQGLKLLYAALPRVKADPKDLKARLDAQFGMWQSIMPSSSGVGTGASHGIGYALGSTFGVAHGHTSCVMLPAVLTWNASVNGERQKALAAAMGQPARPAGALVKELIAGLDQPTSLRDVGIKRENLDEIAKRSLSYQPVRSA
jgi:maleylacetate reductase